VDRAAALAAKEANEAAWCVLESILDRADWGDDSDDAIRVPQLAVDLADRLPQVILPTNLPPVPLPPIGHDGWWTAAVARGVRARRRHDLDQALAFFLELQAAAKTPAQVARAAFERGATHLGQGHLVLAEKCFRQALAATADGDLLADEALASRAGHARVALCLVRCQRGAFSEALSHAAEARRIFSRLDLPGPLANLPALESPCHLWLGDLDSAEATARQSLEAYARRGSPARLVPLMNLAAVAHHRGQHALLEDILDEVGRRAVVEEPRLLVVVGLYAVLLQALRKGDRAAAALHWEEHEAAWSARPEWHPALGRMLWDLVQATTAAGWHRLARAAAARLDEVRTHHGSDCLAAFGVPVSEPVSAQ
jgi:tetratricopeptide (TPR) repeat protein